MKLFEIFLKVNNLILQHLEQNVKSKINGKTNLHLRHFFIIFNHYEKVWKEVEAFMK